MALQNIWAINSEGECLLDVEKVIGSNPILPTKSKDTPIMAYLFHKGNNRAVRNSDARS